RQHGVEARTPLAARLLERVDGRLLVAPQWVPERGRRQSRGEVALGHHSPSRLREPRPTQFPSAHVLPCLIVPAMCCSIIPRSCAESRMSTRAALIPSPLGEGSDARASGIISGCRGGCW